MIDVHVPKVGMSMESATLVRWLCAVGDTVKEGDLLAEVEAEKSVFEIESPAAGTVQEFLVQAEAEIAPGDVIARIAP